MDKPLYQRIITSYLPWILLGVTFVGSLIDTINNLELISPIVTYVGTAMIIGLMFFLQNLFQKDSIYWIAETGERIRIKSLGIKNIIVGLGLIFALWIPRFLPETSKPFANPPVTVIPPAITVVVPNSNSTIIKPVGVIFEDRFEQQGIESEWKWVDPANDSDFEENISQGLLRISTNDENHNLYEVDNYNAPRLMLPVSYDNFAITTHVTIPYGTNYQGAGLLLWQDEFNYVRLEYAHGFNRTRPHIWYRTNGDFQGPGDERNAPDSSFLKIVRTGTTVRTFFSNDNINWNQIGDVVYIRSDLPMWVGLSLISGAQGSNWSAEFDFFILEEY